MLGVEASSHSPQQGAYKGWLVWRPQPSRVGGLLANQSGHCVVEHGHNFGQSFHPSSRPARGHIHFHYILVTKQPFSQGAVESLTYCLISVDIGSPAANGNIVLIHSFGHSPHELAPRVDLQQLWPLERTTSVYLGKAFGHFIALLRC